MPGESNHDEADYSAVFTLLTSEPCFNLSGEGRTSLSTALRPDSVGISRYLGMMIRCEMRQVADQVDLPDRPSARQKLRRKLDPVRGVHQACQPTLAMPAVIQDSNLSRFLLENQEIRSRIYRNFLAERVTMRYSRLIDGVLTPHMNDKPRKG